MSQGCSSSNSEFRDQGLNGGCGIPRQPTQQGAERVPWWLGQQAGEAGFTKIEGRKVDNCSKGKTAETEGGGARSETGDTRGDRNRCE